MKLLTLEGNHNLIIWNAKTRSQIGKPIKYSIKCVCFFPNSTKFITTSDHKLAIWDSNTGNIIEKPLKH